VQESLDFSTQVFDVLSKGAMYSHDVGLQGEKRRLRYLGREAIMLGEKLQHGARDIYACMLWPAKAKHSDVNGLTTMENTMIWIINKLWQIHDEYHRIANEMVVGRNRTLSICVYNYCNCIMKEIAALQRNHEGYSRASYDWHHVSRHQETEFNIHDHFEDKEEGQGYSDHK